MSFLRDQELGCSDGWKVCHLKFNQKGLNTVVSEVLSFQGNPVSYDTRIRQLSQIDLNTKGQF